MDRIVEEHWVRHPGDNEAAVYFAMLKHSVAGLLATHDRFTPDTDYREEIGEVLRIMRDRVGPPDGAEEAEPEWPEPEIGELRAPSRASRHRRHDGPEIRPRVRSPDSGPARRAGSCRSCAPGAPHRKIGRASCRERVCQYV